MKQPSPTQAIVIVAAIQFVYVLDFIMLLPLGPDLAKALAFASDKLGWLSAAYTSAAVISGLLSVSLPDRFDRRSLLLLACGAVGLCTLADDFRQQPVDDDAGTRPDRPVRRPRYRARHGDRHRPHAAVFWPNRQCAPPAW